MIANFVNLADNKFTLNGIEYHKNYAPIQVNQSDSQVRVISAYDSRFALVPPTHYSEYTVNGITYTSVESLIHALVDVVFSKFTLDGVAKEFQDSVLQYMDDIQTDVTNFKGGVNRDLQQITAEKQVFESEAQDIKDAVANMTTTGKIYDSLADAIAENPKPEDGTPFSVMGDGDNDGYWKFDSAETEGVKFGRKFDRRIQVESISLLRQYKGRPGEAIDVLGYYESGDGGGGTFYWDAASTEDDNGGTIIQATGITGGRWKRRFEGAINVKWFGAKGDAVTDDTEAIQSAINLAAILGGGDVIFPDKKTFLVSQQGSLDYISSNTGASLTQYYCLLLKNSVHINLNKSTIFLSDNQNAAILINESFDFRTTRGGDIGILNGALDINRQNQQMSTGGSTMASIFFQNADKVSINNIEFHNVRESSFKLVGVDYVDADLLYTSYSDGDAYRIGAFSPTQVYEGRVRYSKFGTLHAENCQNGVYNTLQGNPVIAAATFSTFGTIYADSCGGGFKFQEGCYILSIGQAVFKGATDNATLTNSTSNSGLKIQGGTFPDHSPEYINVGEVISENSRGSGLWLEYCDSISVSSYIGRFNSLNGANGDCRIGNSRYVSIRSFNSYNSGSFGLYLRKDAFDTVIGDAIIIDPSEVNTYTSGVQVQGGSHRIGKCIIRDTRQVPKMRFAFDVAGASAVGSVDMIDCSGLASTYTREESAAFRIYRKIENGEEESQDSNRELSGNIIPNGYLTPDPVNFRFDQDVLRYVNRWENKTIIAPQFHETEIDKLFSQYAESVRIDNKTSPVTIEVSGISIPSNDSKNFWPFILFHTPDATEGITSVKMEIKKGGVWIETFNGTPDEGFIISKFSAAEFGNLEGVKWTIFFPEGTPTTLRSVGCIGKNAEAYQWTVKRGGDKMFGDLVWEMGTVIIPQASEDNEAVNLAQLNEKVSGASGSYTSQDGKTVTVENGLITSIE